MAVANSVGQYNENAGATYHARDLRRFHDKLLGWDVRVPNAGLATSGVANGGVARYYGAATTGDLAVVQRGAGANMSVDVGAGAAMVGGTEAATQGEYFVFNDATVNVVISASDPTNPRIDVIGIQIRDSEYSGASNDARILVITGTPAASPAVPTLPADFLSLAHVAVAAAAATIVTGNITDKRRNLTSLGGVIICTSSTRPTVNLWPGMVIVETDTTRFLVYDGAAWQRLSYWSSSGRTGCFVTRVAAQSINSAAATTVQWDTVVQIDTFITITSDTITIPSGLGGLYLGIPALSWGSPPASRSFMNPIYNGNGSDASRPYGRYAPNQTNADDQSQFLPWFQPMSVADTFKVQCFQQSGGALNIVAQMAFFRVGF